MENPSERREVRVGIHIAIGSQLHAKPLADMKNHSTSTLLSASAFAMFFTSCESPQEEAREDKVLEKADRMEEQADQVRDNAEKAADLQEDTADAIRESTGNEKAADAIEETADELRDAAEEKADAMEDQADIIREAE